MLLASPTTTQQSPSNTPTINLAGPTRDSNRLEAIGFMTAGIVHDLGNLIQILSSAVNILDRHPQIQNTKALHPVIAGAQTSLEKAGALVHQILGFARASSVPEELLDLTICLQELEKLLQWAVRQEIKLDIRIDANIPALVCNRQSLETAVMNLVLNASDAMTTGGVILITVSHQYHSINGDDIILSVSDTGIGMTPETTALAFDPFFTTKGSARGTGLGLAMVRHFALEAGGSAMIDSKLGVGTKVTLRLPTRDARR